MNRWKTIAMMSMGLLAISGCMSSQHIVTGLGDDYRLSNTEPHCTWVTKNEVRQTTFAGMRLSSRSTPGEAQLYYCCAKPTAAPVCERAEKWTGWAQPRTVSRAPEPSQAPLVSESRTTEPAPRTTELPRTGPLTCQQILHLQGSGQDQEVVERTIRTRSVVSGTTMCLNGRGAASGLIDASADAEKKTMRNRR